ncbi:alpha/beta hydrolase [Crateriforma conspicua]|uniref:Phospholipase YtpA n=1 Tax=Crateriforma conspicua TaxID=2527996 RepID=A0A5C6FL40_9PLAN|nr:alpha/beta hydrolase [Crateriforma conspicua]TWU61862.1 Phospholipase YtpA [Crateriforma conspicua]
MSVLPDDTLISSDDRPLHMRLYGDRSAAMVLVVVHGLGEHSGWYQEFAKRFSKGSSSEQDHGKSSAKCGVLLYDQRGHGKSPGRRGDAESLQNLVDDVAVAIEAARQHFPNAQPILVGHSLGGHLVLRHLIENAAGADHSSPVQRAVVTNPMILPENPPTKPQAFAAWVTAKLIPRLRFSASIDATELTHDADVLRELADDPLVHEQLSIGIGGALMASGHELVENADQISADLLVLTGGDDTLCDRESTQQLVDRCDTARRKEFAGLKHNLLLESDRQQVYDTIDDWLIEKTN